MKKKAPLARTLRWAQARDIFTREDCVRFTLAVNWRLLNKDVGAALKRRGDEGRVTFLDKVPEQIAYHLLAVGTPNGILVTYFDGSRYSPVSEFVWMCPTYRNRIVGGVGKVRWAKVKAA